MRISIQTRGLRSITLGGLILLGCLAIASAQSSTTDTEKTAAQKSAPHKPHKSTAKASATTRTSTFTKRGSKKKSTRTRGQQKIDSERATAIQEALIREHYLTGEATGTWNQASEDAMRRYQADQGWQSKTVPDSRALIKLGLGPSKDHLLNPESAMTTVPDRASTQATPTSQTPAPVSSTPAPDSQTSPSSPQ